MKIFVKSFVAANRKFCRLLEKIFPKFFGSPRCYNRDQLKMIAEILQQRNDIKVLEAGGVDRPMLNKSSGFSYYGMDIDDKPSCYDCYDKFLVQSIEERITDKFDLIISTTLLEHVPNNKKSVKAMYDAINDDGLMIHYIPSRNHFYSICLRLVGPKLQKILIKYLRPEAFAVTGYPAFFDKCSPNEMKNLCRAQGFKDIEVICYYKATDYFAFFVPAYLLVAICENLFEYIGVTHFSSGFIIKAKK